MTVTKTNDTRIEVKGVFNQTTLQRVVALKVFTGTVQYRLTDIHLVLSSGSMFLPCASPFLSVTTLTDKVSQVVPVSSGTLSHCEFVCVMTSLTRVILFVFPCITRLGDSVLV